MAFEIPLRKSTEAISETVICKSNPWGLFHEALIGYLQHK